MSHATPPQLDTENLAQGEADDQALLGQSTQCMSMGKIRSSGVICGKQCPLILWLAGFARVWADLRSPSASREDAGTGVVGRHNNMMARNFEGGPDVRIPRNGGWT